MINKLIYDDIKKAKSMINIVINTFAIIGIVGILILLFIIVIWG